MKKTIISAVCVLLFAGCSNECDLTHVENNTNKGEKARVTVRVSEFSVTKEDLPTDDGTTRGKTDPANYERVNAIDLVFYDSSGTEVYSSTQMKGNTNNYETFGEFACDLPVGTYTMVAVGRYYYNGDVFTITSPTSAAYTSERPRETFCATQSATVTSTKPMNLSVTLNRICAMLTIESTDKRPAEVTKIRTTYAKGGKGFNPTTGLATSDGGFAQINNPSTAVGATIGVSSYVFLAAAADEEETMDITIEALDANEHVLTTKVATNVPLQRNCKTTLTGELFTPGTSSVAFQVETSWGSEKKAGF